MLNNLFIGAGLLAAFMVTHAALLALPDCRIKWYSLEALGWTWAVSCAVYIELPSNMKFIDPTVRVISGWDDVIALCMIAFAIMSATIARFDRLRSQPSEVQNEPAHSSDCPS